MNPKSEIRTPKFTLASLGPQVIITDTGSGAQAEIIKDGESYFARNLTNFGNMTAKRQAGLLKRMGEWYYHTQVKK